MRFQKFCPLDTEVVPPISINNVERPNILDIMAKPVLVQKTITLMPRVMVGRAGKEGVQVPFQVHKHCKKLVGATKPLGEP